MIHQGKSRGQFQGISFDIYGGGKIMILNVFGIFTLYPIFQPYFTPGTLNSHPRQ